MRIVIIRNFTNDKIDMENDLIGETPAVKGESALGQARLPARVDRQIEFVARTNANR